MIIHCRFFLSFKWEIYEEFIMLENMNENYQEETVNFWEQFPLSFMPQKYGKLVHATKGQMIGFITLFMLIITIVLAGKFYIVSVPEMNTFFEQCPEFSLANGTLELEKDYELAQDDLYICASDSIEDVEMSDVQDLQEEYGYSQILIVGKKNLVFYNNGQYQTAKFSDFGNLKIDRNFVVNDLANMINVIVGIGFACYFVFGTLMFFFFALWYFLVMIIVSKIFKREVENGYLYKTCVYGKVFMVVVATLISLLPISITIPTYGRTMITLGFLVFALSKLPQKN